MLASAEDKLGIVSDIFTEVLEELWEHLAEDFLPRCVQLHYAQLSAVLEYNHAAHAFFFRC